MLCFNLHMLKLSCQNVANCLGLACNDQRVIESYAIDSRLVQPGGLFFAIQGEKVDGHDFAAQAVENGAVGIVTSKSIDIKGVAVFMVPDVRQALQDLARFVYRQKKCRVIGVTGSLGKTSTKECISQGLRGAMNVGQSPASYNSQLTLPIAILNCPEDADVCVLEYAMSEKGQLKRLVEIAPPDIGVMTPIDYVHAENFDSLAEIANEKAELFRSPVMQQGFVHYKSWDFMADVGSFPKLRYGKDATGPFSSKALNENYSALEAVANYLGVNQLSPVTMPPKRFELVEKAGVTFVNDSYNANVMSFKAAMENLPKGKRLVGVLGSMGELGQFSKTCHDEVAKIAEDLFDELLYLGDDWKDVIKPQRLLFPSFDTLQTALAKMLKPGDVVLIKGSNYHKLWRLLDLV